MCWDLKLTLGGKIKRVFISSSKKNWHKHFLRFASLNNQLKRFNKWKRWTINDWFAENAERCDFTSSVAGTLAWKTDRAWLKSVGQLMSTGYRTSPVFQSDERVFCFRKSQTNAAGKKLFMSSFKNPCCDASAQPSRQHLLRGRFDEAEYYCGQQESNKDPSDWRWQH